VHKAVDLRTLRQQPLIDERLQLPAVVGSRRVKLQGIAVDGIQDFVVINAVTGAQRRPLIELVIGAQARRQVVAVAGAAATHRQVVVVVAKAQVEVEARTERPLIFKVEAGDVLPVAKSPRPQLDAVVEHPHIGRQVGRRKGAPYTRGCQLSQLRLAELHEVTAIGIAAAEEAEVGGLKLYARLDAVSLVVKSQLLLQQQRIFKVVENVAGMPDETQKLSRRVEYRHVGIGIVTGIRIIPAEHTIEIVALQSHLLTQVGVFESYIGRIAILLIGCRREGAAPFESATLPLNVDKSDIDTQG